MTEQSGEGEDFVESFVEAWKRLHRLAERSLASTGLTLAELRVLRFLSTSGPSPMARIGSHLYMTPASITGLVDALEEQHLVTRERDTRDRRVVHVRVTPLGVERFETGRKHYNKFMETTLRSLSKEEARQVVEIFAKLNRAAESIQAQ